MDGTVDDGQTESLPKIKNPMAPPFALDPGTTKNLSRISIESWLKPQFENKLGTNTKNCEKQDPLGMVYMCNKDKTTYNSRCLFVLLSIVIDRSKFFTFGSRNNEHKNDGKDFCGILGELAPAPA